MIICFYAEALRPATTGTPMRGLLYYLVKHRPFDQFILVFRTRFEGDSNIEGLLSKLQGCSNWTVVFEKHSRRFSNFLAILRIRDYCKLSFTADLYISPDAHSFGKSRHPLLVVIHDLSSYESINQSSFGRRWQRRLRQFMIQNAIQESDKVVAISNFTKNSIAKFFPTHERKVSVVYNSIDPRWILQPSVSNTTNEKYFIWWGMDSPRKNLVGLISAFSIAVSQYLIPFKLMLVCSNRISKDLSLLINITKLEEKVLVLPNQDLATLITLVDKSEGLLFPSFIEGFGMPVIETFARGKPVLTSNTSSLIEVSNGMAILVPPNDVNAIAQGIVCLSKQNKGKVDSTKRKDWAKTFSVEFAMKSFNQIIDDKWENQS